MAAMLQRHRRFNFLLPTLLVFLRILFLFVVLKTQTMYRRRLSSPILTQPSPYAALSYLQFSADAQLLPFSPQHRARYPSVGAF